MFRGIMNSYNVHHDLHFMMYILSHMSKDLSGLFLKFTDISQELVLNQFKNIEIYTSSNFILFSFRKNKKSKKEKFK